MPLQQIVNRLTEMSLIKTKSNYMRSKVNYPKYKYAQKSDSSKFSHIEIRDGFTLTVKFENKWFLTKSGEVVAMNYTDNSGIIGSKLKKITDLFTDPICSREINVFKTHDTTSNNLEEAKIYAIEDILCKLVATKFFAITIFVPLHHTYPDE